MEVSFHTDSMSNINFSEVFGCVAPEFSVAQKQVSDLLKGRILVGHSLQNDMKVHCHCEFMQDVYVLHVYT